MSNKTELQNNNADLQAILDAINGIPSQREILRFTSLPASGTQLAANAEYYVTASVDYYQFNFPKSGDVYVRFTTAATFGIGFVSGITYLGEVPEFEASTTYELMARDGIVAVAAVVSA